MSEDAELVPLSDEELNAQVGSVLPDKEVVSILDLNVDLALAIDAAAPIELAVAANANVAAPIDAAVGTNILSSGSEAQALADQGVLITQGIDADATAHAVQVSGIDQSDDVVDAGSSTPVESGAPDDVSSGGSEPAGGPTAAGTETPTESSTGSADEPSTTAETAGEEQAAVVPGTGLETPDTSQLLNGSLLDVNVNVDADVDLAAPIAGAVAANANVAAPIDAAVAANVGSVDSQAVAVAQQDAIINQDITGSATADAEQTSDIEQ
ncbi:MULTISPECIES: peptidoglycan-binding protein [Kribbella]|uniref:Peptidoglycan-binding protein n=1 Tax=Kribbella pratensis TaxID=2512112 RepID=A0ABY2FIE0_9ACTN|nr:MULTISPECIES: peptidoglycan-binding protein [Kribbella]TDW90865.1 hypothetical protein EV137_4694 [Kribbella pratensis]TDW98623.1 hypothetical protein EV647_3347 [Kribbella sp. VKM Ac-2566]